MHAGYPILVTGGEAKQYQYQCRVCGLDKAPQRIDAPRRPAARQAPESAAVVRDFGVQLAQALAQPVTALDGISAAQFLLDALTLALEPFAGRWGGPGGSGDQQAGGNDRTESVHGSSLPGSQAHQIAAPVSLSR
jgi:hypothetical protein